MRLKIPLQKYRGSHSIDDALAFLPAHIGRDQKVFGFPGRQTFVPGDDRNRQRFSQTVDKSLNGLRSRPFLSVESKR